ncbi:MAG TPA: hypothetical protein VK168_11745 [Saprospiraceae bacterium]|nr:hypothetical protein [Saprospiraceae bacterium]
MFKPLYTLSVILTLLSVSNLKAQIKQISLSGTFAPIINTINITEINHTAIGASIEFEYKSKRHVSFGMELDWQKYKPEAVYVQPHNISNSVLIKYFIERNQLNLRPIFRYYWKEGFEGFYAGGFGVYSYLMTTPKESPMVIGYPSTTIDYAYKSAAGFGLTCGYRFKLTPALKLSALGNYQVVFSEIRDDNSAHQDLQFGLGLNWAF